MGERDHLGRIAPLRLQQPLGDPVDLPHGIQVVDVAILHLHRTDQHIGGAEHLPVFLVQLDIRVFGRVQGKEVGGDFQRRDPIGKNPGHQRYQQQHGYPVPQQEPDVSL